MLICGLLFCSVRTFQFSMELVHNGKECFSLISVEATLIREFQMRIGSVEVQRFRSVHILLALNSK